MELGDLLYVAEQIVLLAPKTQGQILALEDVAVVLDAREQVVHVGLLRLDQLLQNGVHALVALVPQLDLNLFLSGNKIFGKY